MATNRKRLSVEEYADVVRKVLKDAGKPLRAGEFVRVVARRAGAKNPDNYSGITQLIRLNQALKTVLKGEVVVTKEGPSLFFSLGKSGNGKSAAKSANGRLGKRAVVVKPVSGRKGRKRDKDTGGSVSFTPIVQFLRRVQRQMAESGKGAYKAVENVQASADKVSDDVQQLREELKSIKERYEPMHRAFLMMNEQVQAADMDSQ